jgi:hypothetical protein
MSTVLETRIKKRGFWRVRITPGAFRETLFPEVSDLKALVNQISIDAGNLSFPTVGQEPVIGKDWIGQDLDTWEYCQTWRLYQSGQFILYEGFVDDWLDRSWFGEAKDDWKPGVELSVSDALYTYWLAFEFAARLAAVIDGEPELRVSIHAFGLTGRQLKFQFRNRTGLRVPRVATLNDFAVDQTLSRKDLIAAPTDYTVEAARALFARFHWDVGADFLRTLLKESGATI